MFIEGQDIARLRNGAVPYLRRKVSVVFQDFRLLPEMTVFENVAFALRVAGYKRKQIDERVLETLELVKMDNYRDRFPHQLSGGEQQRVAIARAIVHKPPVLVADEPTGNLDPDTAAETVQLLVQINALGTTLLMATHNRDLVDTMQRRVVALEAGRIVRDEQRAGYV